MIEIDRDVLRERFERAGVDVLAVPVERGSRHDRFKLARTRVVERSLQFDPDRSVLVHGVAEIAAALDEFPLFSFVLEVGNLRSRSCSPELAPLYEVTEPFEAVGMGFTVIEGRRAVVTTTAFRSASAASSMVEPTRNVWTGFLDPIEGQLMSDVFELVDVSAVGTVVTVVAVATDDTQLRSAYTLLLKGAPVAAYC